MVAKVYIPVELEKYLTCRMLKEIIDISEEHFDYSDQELYLLPKGAEEKFHNKLYRCSENFDLEIKGHLKITNSKIFDCEETKLLYEVTNENLNDIKSMYDRNEIEVEEYLVEVMEYDVYVEEFILYESRTNNIIFKSNENSDMKLVYSDECGQEVNPGEVDFLNVKTEILRVADKLVDSELRIIHMCNGDRSIKYFRVNPCKTCMDRCDDKLNAKPTMPVVGFEVIDINNIDKEVVVKYLEKIKEEMEQLKDKVVSERKVNKRITYDAFCWLFMFREFMYSDVYLLSSYLKAMDELNSKPNLNVKKNIIKNEEDFFEILELKEYVATMGIDLYDFLDLHKDVIKMLEDN
ncbi:MAG: hypothetical protein J6D47_10480 [Peptostreptococcaceae bacterium]|nr:hypothetical protein [Peptostreptococcaceae bacterium]